MVRLPDQTSSPERYRFEAPPPRLCDSVSGCRLEGPGVAFTRSDGRLRVPLLPEDPSIAVLARNEGD